MRILFLCHRYMDTQIGGMAEFLNYLPLSLKKIGIESIIYTQSEHKSNLINDPIILPNDIACYTGPFLKPGFFTSNKSLNPFLNLCRDENIDLIHAQGLYRSGYMAMKTFHKIGIPYVVTSHSDILSASSDRMKRNTVQNRCINILKHAKATTHLTPMMAEVAHNIFDTREKSAIIGNGIDLKTWNTYQSSNEKNYLLAIGRLVKEKGFHILIEAFSKLKNANTSLLIAGSGCEEINLQNQARDLGLDVITNFNEENMFPNKSSVIFTGYVTGARKMKLISEAKIILFAPQPEIWEEPFGIVQLEAMVAGKALIASNTAASRYLQKSGLQACLVKPNDIEEWHRAITKLLDNLEIKDVMGKQNLQNAHQFDWSLVAKKYKMVYQNN